MGIIEDGLAEEENQIFEEKIKKYLKENLQIRIKCTEENNVEVMLLINGEVFSQNDVFITVN